MLRMERPTLFLGGVEGLSHEGLADSGNAISGNGEGVPAPFRLSDEAQGPTVGHQKLKGINA